ncbi:MAG: lytic transglycosylase domain-containing protein [Chitinophagaceae bacterium]|nr:lytic transglycosylase domain-containing protein [Chitinophagaceae bacterium]
MLGLSKIYFPVFDQIFSQYGIPPEVKYLAIIESALNPHAVSRMGATGMWQFMYGTAKQYGLTINSYVDERKDIIRSTEGAAQYLREACMMYMVIGYWPLHHITAGPEM